MSRFKKCPFWTTILERDHEKPQHIAEANLNSPLADTSINIDIFEKV